MDIKDSSKYNLYQMVVKRMGAMIYNISGDLKSQSEMEELVQDVIESAYRDGYKEGSRNAVEKHFEKFSQSFK